MVEIYGYSISTVPIVCAIVYGTIEFLKHFFFCENERFKKFIPLLSSLFGAFVTLIMFFVCPEIVPAVSWESALLIGAASGLSAVGVNQIKKQIEKGGETDGT